MITGFDYISKKRKKQFTYAHFFTTFLLQKRNMRMRTANHASFCEATTLVPNDSPNQPENYVIIMIIIITQNQI